jgi:protein O-GlcNAc transferase
VQSPDQLFQQALAHHREGRLAEASALYVQALTIRPAFFDALHMLGVACHQGGQPHQGVALISKAIELRPQIAQAHNNLGNALITCGQIPEAIAAYEQAANLKPDFAEAFYNAGCALAKLGEYPLAISCYSKAIEIEPYYWQAYANRGLAFERTLIAEMAADDYKAALKLDPRNADLHFKLGNNYFLQHMLPEALEEFGQVLDIQPNTPYILGNVLQAKAQLCDWEDWKSSINPVIDLIQSGCEHALHPMHITYYIDDPAVQRKVAEDWIKTNHPTASTPFAVTAPDKRIRVGFFSADFRTHPVSQLLLEFFENHDREQFEFIAFSYRNVDDHVQQRLRNAFSRFVDIESMGHLTAANLARDMGLHLAVDLGGYTTDARTEIFAYRVAPVQVNFLGYPATTGSQFIDYIIADHQVIPPEDEIYYTERVARLPHCFMPRDCRVQPSGATLTRTQFGLPEAGMVYCCFNSHVKYTPDMFDLWMKILAQVDGSVLWLATPPASVCKRLKLEATRAGIDADRIVFATRGESFEDHLQRLFLADLFVDTWPYNAHTTASDALFAGLPVLTYAGRTFASRVAASMLLVLGVPDLICNSPEVYLETAIRLGHDSAALQKVKEQVQSQRLTSPLFNSTEYNRNLSELLSHLASSHLSH